MPVIMRCQRGVIGDDTVDDDKCAPLPGSSPARLNYTSVVFRYPFRISVTDVTVGTAEATGVRNGAKCLLRNGTPRLARGDGLARAYVALRSH
jgi:hypothetical protein